MSRQSIAVPNPEELNTKITIYDSSGEFVELELTDPKIAKQILELSKAENVDYKKIYALADEYSSTEYDFETGLNKKREIPEYTFEERVKMRNAEVAADLMAGRNKKGDLYKELAKRYEDGINL